MVCKNKKFIIILAAVFSVSGALRVPDTDSFGDFARSVFGVKEAMAQSAADNLLFGPNSQSYLNYANQGMVNEEINAATGGTAMQGGGFAGYPVTDPGGIIQRFTQWLKDAAIKNKEKAKKASIGTAIRSATRVFVQNFAYQSALKIAEGGPGRQALNWSQPYDEYLEDAGKAALGDFIGNLGDMFGVDLCEPDTLGKLQLTLGLLEKITSPPKPRCDWQDIQSNWQTMDQGEFLKKLSFAFDPKVNYLGSSFALQEEMEAEVQRAKTAAELVRGQRLDLGFKDYNDAISGMTRTPGSMVGNMAAKSLDLAADKMGWDITGSYIMADVISPAFETFFSTLSGRLMEKWLTKGMFNPNLYDVAVNNGIYNPYGSGTTVASHQALENQYSDYLTPTFTAGGNYDVLSELGTCPPYTDYQSPTSCVMDQNFRAAVEEKMTVGEAILSYKLNPEATFGFEADGKEPNYLEGYPYRSMIIMRRYRILPIGWEIAAEYINKFSIKKRYSLQEMIDCYDPQDERNKTGVGVSADDEWCHGLVDPDWLLKAPANNCEKMAEAGQEIISEQFMGGSNNIPSERVVDRNEFCAVNKSCINESADGKCLKWGNCVEEKRIWRFKGESCDENYNSCQTFVPSPLQGEGQGEVSYLKNTLDYGICDGSNAGCAWYCAEGTWDSASSTVEWDCEIQPGENPAPTLPSKGRAFLFDRDAESCEEEHEGCHEFIPLNEKTNLLYNGGFEKGEGEQKLEIGNLKLAEGQKFNYWSVEKNLENSITISLENGAAKIEANGAGAGIYSFSAADEEKKKNSLMPDGFRFDKNKNYVLSADLKVEQGKAEIGFSGGGEKKEVIEGKAGENAITRIQVILEAGEFLADKIFIRSANGSDNVFSVNNISLHETTQNGTQNYTNYWDNAVYLRKAPDYLGCGTDDQSDKCSDFAIFCAEEMVGCSKYSPINGTPWIPAIAEEEDKCDIECVNYKSYNQSAANFTREISDVNFIADSPYARTGVRLLGESDSDAAYTGKVCPAEAVGCAEFTNLDELEKGGELKEYYTRLKQCIAIDAEDNPISGQGEVLCGNFYSYTGSNTGGYQMEKYYLQKNPSEFQSVTGNSNQPDGPLQISNPQNFGACAGPEDVKINPNCRELYNEANKPFYAIWHNTVTCSENCHPYRKTRENISESLCAIYGSDWLETGEKATVAFGVTVAEEVAATEPVCKMEIENCLYSGGKWINNECVYMAAPDEGKLCEAQYEGCFEYKGTTSENVRIAMSDDFEDGTNMSWNNGVSSSAARVVGEQCLAVSSSGSLTKDLTSVGSLTKDLTSVLLDKTKIYEISFLASNKGADKVAKLILKGKDFYAMASITLSSSVWLQYKTNGMILGGDMSNNGDGDGKIDGDDLAILDKAISNPMSVTARQRELADINGDGFINGVADNGIREDRTDGKLLADFIAVPTATSTIEIQNIDSNIFLDNIVIKEIQSSIYRIKDSWTIPEKCDFPISQLGCEEYEIAGAGDTAMGNVFLKEFSNICPSWAIGCEKMIDTYNSESMFEEKWDLNGDVPSLSETGVSAVLAKGQGEVFVPRDSIVYYVNDPIKYGCLEEEKGCQRFGAPVFNQDKTALSGYAGDVFIKNNQDKYSSISCVAKALECSEYSWNNGEISGTKYFKNPGEKVCEFKDGKWYKVPSPLQGEGQGEVQLCPTTVDINLTIGENPVEVPSEAWVGICPQEQSGCTEFLDPLSDNEPNIVFNGNFEQDAQGLDNPNLADGPDGWGEIIGCGANCSECCNNGYALTKAIQKGAQDIKLTENTAYTLSARVKGTGAISISGCEILSIDGTIEMVNESSAKLNFVNSQGEIKSGRFYLKALSSYGNCKLQISADNRSFVDEVALQKTDIYYYISGSLKADDCQNYSLEKGCILVNDREVLSDNGNISHKSLTDNIDNAFNGQASFCNSENTSCVPNANRIIKADPDRVCGKWLYDLNTVIVEDKDTTTNNKTVVYDVGECIAFDEAGGCDRTVISDKKNINFQPGSVDLMKNISGLGKVGFNWQENYKIEGYYPLSRMTQIGQYIKLDEGGFETSENGNPVGWIVEGKSSWDEAAGKIISTPKDAQDKGLEKKAPVGKGFLELNAPFAAKLIANLPVYENGDYILSGYINSRNILTPGTTSTISAIIYDEAGQQYTWNLELAEGTGWTELSKKIKAPDDASNMEIILKNINNSGDIIQGSSYFDEISIRTALQKQDILDNSLSKDGVSPSICKIYPEKDALSCEYIDENGLGRKGERGYCLEYDRYPGNSDICINWFPVDVIRGEEGEEIPPFSTQAIYHCLEAENPDLSYLLGGFTKKEGRVKIYLNGKPLLKKFVGYRPEGADTKLTVHLLLTALEEYYKNDKYDIIVDSNIPQLKYGENIIVIDLTETRECGNLGVAPNFYYKYGDEKIVIENDDMNYPWKYQAGCIATERGDSGRGTNCSFTPDAVKFDYDDSNWTEGIYYTDADRGSILLRKKFFIEPLKTYCKTIISTATADGKSAEWKYRITDGNYVVESLNYRKDYWYYPFGKIHSDMFKKGITSFSEPIYLVKSTVNSMTGSNVLVPTGLPYSCAETNLPYSFFSVSGDLPDMQELYVALLKKIITKALQDYEADKADGDTDGMAQALAIKEDAESKLNFILYPVDDDATTDADDWKEPDYKVEISELLDEWPEYEAEFGEYLDSTTEDFVIPMTPNMCVLTKDYYNDRLDIDISDIFKNNIKEGKNRLNRIFAKSYGTWEWDGDSYTKETSDDNSLSPPTEICDGSRPTTYPNDWCAIKPWIENIAVSEKSGKDVIVKAAGSVLLQFNSNIDKEQQPMSAYYIDWGDGNITSAEKLRMMSQPTHPHSFTHYYSYNDLKTKYDNDKIIDRTVLQCHSSGSDGCSNYTTGACCLVKPRIRIKDNWGWCSDGVDGELCPDNKSGWASFGNNWIVLTER